MHYLKYLKHSKAVGATESLWARLKIDDCCGLSYLELVEINNGPGLPGKRGSGARDSGAVVHFTSLYIHIN